MEAQHRRELAKREAEKEKQILEEEKRKEKQRQKEALQREFDRRQKAEEYRKKTEALIKAQEDIAFQNRQRMLERERIVQQKMEENSEQRRLQSLRKREQV